MNKYLIGYTSGLGNNPKSEIVELEQITEEMLKRPRLQRGGPEYSPLDLIVQDKIRERTRNDIHGVQVFCFSKLDG